MKKMVLLSIVVLATSLNASALVRSTNFKCSPLHEKSSTMPQPNAPRLGLSCIVSYSFGPTTMNCNATEMTYVPVPSNRTLTLRQIAVTASSTVFGCEGMTAVVQPTSSGFFVAELNYGGLVAECAE